MHVLYVLCFYVVRPIVILHVLFYRHVRRNKDTQYSVQLALASGKFTYQVRWSWHQPSEEYLRSHLPAFLASAASTLLLQDEILGGSQPLPDESAESLKGRWEALYGPAPSGKSATKQSSWDRPGFWPTLPWWRCLKPRHFSELVSSQHKHHKAASGFCRCQ